MGVKPAAAQTNGLVAYWPGNGNALDVVGGANGTPHDGATYAPAVSGQGFSLSDATNAGVAVLDVDSLKLTHSLTITAWIKVNNYPATNPHFYSMILFRGDDRGGLDPYWLGIDPVGNIDFQINSATNARAYVSAAIPTGQFVFIQATLDDATGRMRLYLNGVLRAQTTTTVRPFRDLDPSSNPGVGIGNAQSNSAFSFPFSGIIDELKVYNVALPPVRPPTDVNGDGLSDIMLQNSTTGQILFWFMNGPTVAGTGTTSLNPAAGYQAVGVGDFNGDGKPDIVFQNQTTGKVAIWFMNGSTYIGSSFTSLTPAAGYKVVGVGDFNGDGQPDLVFQNQTTGQVAFWFLNGTMVIGGAVASMTPASGYKVVGVADINGDGYPDLVFQNSTTGQVVFWYMNDTTVITGAQVSQTPAAGVKVVGVGDFNGDGTNHLVLLNPTTGQVSFWYLHGATVTGTATASQAAAGYSLFGPG